MNWFPLPLFPEGSLASSIVTTVWVGVIVFSFMNLRFGWVFSGLVVPGYLVPLLIVKPWAAAIIVIEAVITLWTAQALSRVLARSGVACEFFGRDRFLALLMISAFYRIVADVWILPFVGNYLTSHFEIAFDYRNNLQSFGLIVICLAANQLWKTGVIRGALPFVFNVTITFVIVRYGLMELTNFSITNLGYLYEDIASSVHAAPKAYIILITTAFLASRMNLIYGWDFNGILIPALIALQWYEPIKVLTSFVEALVILFIALQVLKLPMFRSVTVEGSRKFLIFFTISFLYKMTVGWAMFFLDPSAKVSDFYGFGYLLPTLMAIKMHQHERVWHQLRITAQVSLSSGLIANLIGFSLTLLPLSGKEKTADVLVKAPDMGSYDPSQFRIEAYRSFIESHRSILEPEKIQVPTSEESQQFRNGLKSLLFPNPSSQDEIAGTALEMLRACGFRVDRFGNRYYRIKPIAPSSGRPFLFIDLQTDSDLTVCCLDALETRYSFEDALTIYTDQTARILLIGRQPDQAGNWVNSAMQAYDQNGEVIEISGSGSTSGNQLYIKGAVPASLKLLELENRFGKVSSRWEDSERSNLYRDLSNGSYCEFQIDHHPGGLQPHQEFSGKLPNRSMP